MGRPTECKWCGCGSVYSVSDRHVKFTCRSAWTADGDCWACSSQCCDGMRDRIQRAVEVLEGADRWEIITGYESDMERCSNGEWIEHDEAEQAIEILRGNSSKSSDSSPVTADQLATEDYYEAVRQRVPWMTSVQHIEELVDGYRQCGLMVWKAAKHIEDLFGGEHGQTD